MDPKGDSCHRNKASPNLQSGLPAIEAQPTGRFRQLLTKHQPALLHESDKISRPTEMATRPMPNTEPMFSIDSKKTRSKSTHDHRRKSRYYDGERVTLLGRIRTGWRATYRALGVRHWAFVFFLVAYAFVGGAIFSYLEKKHLAQKRQDAITQLDIDRQNLTNLIIALTNSSNETALELDMLLEEYQRRKELFPKTTINWDIWDGVFYSFTVFTTIGYGHFVPETKSGQAATMLYALIGIPLVLAVLADFGKLMTRSLKVAYNGLRHTLARLWQLAKYKRMKAKGEDISANEPQEDMAQFDFPIPLAIIMVLAWLFACCSIYHIWETKWSYFEAFYFFFISLSTIGLGDLTPAHPKYMLASFPFILIGLTLISLVINLIQNQIDKLREKAQEMLEDQLGLDTESASECEECEEGGTPTDQPNISAVSRAEDIKPKLENVALGVLQSVTLRAKRRRIGTQTTESYVRDVLSARPYTAPPRSVFSTPLQSPKIVPSPATGESKPPVPLDSVSVSSSSLSFFTTSQE